jgi:hypothetical protein
VAQLPTLDAYGSEESSGQSMCLWTDKQEAEEGTPALCPFGVTACTPAQSPSMLRGKQGYESAEHVPKNPALSMPGRCLAGMLADMYGIIAVISPCVAADEAHVHAATQGDTSALRDAASAVMRVKHTSHKSVSGCEQVSQSLCAALHLLIRLM